MRKLFFSFQLDNNNYGTTDDLSLTYRLKEPVMRYFPYMRHPSCGQSKCWNLVVTTWTASFKPWTLSVNNKKLLIEEQQQWKYK